jgi:hypothetical protein
VRRPKRYLHRWFSPEFTVSQIAVERAEARHTRQHGHEAVARRVIAELFGPPEERRFAVRY